MLKFSFLQSGSAGNCAVIVSKNTTILIDMGVSYHSLVKGLEAYGKTIDDVKACFITHGHSDHIKGLSYLPSSIKRYSGVDTIFGVPGLKHFQKKRVGDITVTVLPASHDADNTVNYLIESSGTSLGYITDTGFVLEETKEKILNCSYYYLESNYDLEMLMESNRTDYLKHRIDGPTGHLSNRQSATLACELIGTKTKAIYLAHISQDCNTHEKALRTYKKIFKEYGVSLDGISLVPTERFSSVSGGDEDED